VHLIPPVKFKPVALPIEFEDALVEIINLGARPPRWTEAFPQPSTNIVGDRWVTKSRSAVLELPSIIIRTEPNYLLNPAHPDFKRIHSGHPVPFAFDPR
jgi:RES domain-containing protein